MSMMVFYSRLSKGSQLAYIYSRLVLMWFGQTGGDRIANLPSDKAHGLPANLRALALGSPRPYIKELHVHTRHREESSIRMLSLKPPPTLFQDFLEQVKKRWENQVHSTQELVVGLV